MIGRLTTVCTINPSQLMDQLAQSCYGKPHHTQYIYWVCSYLFANRDIEAPTY